MERQQNQIIFDRLTQHVPQWKQSLEDQDDLIIKRLSGLSNACFRVKIKDDVALNVSEPRTLLYRRFEQELTDRRIEEAIFKAKSEDGTGPKLYFMN